MRRWKQHEAAPERDMIEITGTEVLRLIAERLGDTDLSDYERRVVNGLTLSANGPGALAKKLRISPEMHKVLVG